jgi:hypothetical protein
MVATATLHLISSPGNSTFIMIQSRFCVNWHLMLLMGLGVAASTLFVRPAFGQVSPDFPGQTITGRNLSLEGASSPTDPYPTQFNMKNTTSHQLWHWIMRGNENDKLTLWRLDTKPEWLNVLSISKCTGTCLKFRLLAMSKPMD